MRARSALDRLARHPHARVRQVAQACEDALYGRFDPEAEAVIGRIEALRTRAAASTESIVFEDFGAGAPDANLSEEQMAAGRKLERTVGALCRAASKRPV